jgi:oligoribonuclease
MLNIPAEYLVWIDCEMTGLEVENDGLIEIAVLLTDFDLNVLDDGIDLVINPGPEALAHMNDYVHKMHTESGLLPLIENGLSVKEAEQKVLDYIKKHGKGSGRPLVGGNTIGMDRRFISRYMPRLDEKLHYRSVDVSTLKELSRRWFEPSFWNAPEKHGGHRALADIAESIQELAYFKRTVLVDAPGPDAAEAQRVSGEVVHSFAKVIETAHKPNGSEPSA